jgi:hypothetical protein
VKRALELVRTEHDDDTWRVRLSPETVAQAKHHTQIFDALDRLALGAGVPAEHLDWERIEVLFGERRTHMPSYLSLMFRAGFWAGAFHRSLTETGSDFRALLLARFFADNRRSIAFRRFLWTSLLLYARSERSSLGESFSTDPYSILSDGGIALHHATNKFATEQLKQEWSKVAHHILHRFPFWLRLNSDLANAFSSECPQLVAPCFVESRDQLKTIDIKSYDPVELSTAITKQGQHCLESFGCPSHEVFEEALKTQQAKSYRSVENATLELATTSTISEFRAEIRASYQASLPLQLMVWLANANSSFIKS